MVKINGIAYMLIGAVISLYSFFANFQKLILFFILGIIGIIFGVIRMIIDREPQKKTSSHHHASQAATAQQQPLAILCHACGTKVHHFQNFCHICGQQLMHRR